MCTLSIFRTKDGYNVFMNRDERLERTDETPPQMIDPASGIYGPLDPPSGGTWIAHNQNGFWGCILNGYFEDPDQPQAPKESRGKILLEILASKDPIKMAKEMDAKRFPSFRLVVGSPLKHHLYVWNGKTYQEQDFHVNYDDQAYFLTSSSWQQERVIDVRKELFEDWIKDQSYQALEVPSLHLCILPDPESAICMKRSYSRTKSITSLHIKPNNIAMDYKAIL